MGGMDLQRVEKHIFAYMEDYLPKDLHFHCIAHTKEVYGSARHYAVEEGLTEEETIWVLTAALFHDVGFVRQYSKNEPVGAEIAREMLAEFGYDAQAREVIAQLILATQLPQRPVDRLQEILCDADLDHLGRADFRVKGELLRREREIYQDLHCTDGEWQKVQLDFLEVHRYFTKAAKRLRDQGKARNIDWIRRQLGGVSGDSRG